MDAFLSAVSAVGLILMMTAVGFLFGRAGWMKGEHKAFLVRLIMDVALPAMCINGLLGSMDRALLFQSARYVLISLGLIGLFVPLSFCLAKALGLPRERVGVFVCMAAFSNSMFIGMPMCLALFGEGATPFVLCYYIANTLLFQTLGVAMLDYSGCRERRPLGTVLKKLMRPPLWAVLVSVALILLDLQLPSILMQFAKYMAGLVSPLALLYTGFVLYELGFKKLRPDGGSLLMLGFRFMLAPLAMGLLCRLFQIPALPQGVLCIEIAMPVMTQVVVLCADAGADEGYAALGTALSTLACFAAVPLLMAYFGG